MKRGKGRDMAAEYAAVREILKPYAERAEAAEAALAAEREHHHHAHGPNCQEAEAEVERLREALTFYSDTRRYQGANQPYRDGDDPFTPTGSPFLIDVMRDGGAIARAALRGGPCSACGDGDVAQEVIR